MNFQQVPLEEEIKQEKSNNIHEISRLLQTSGKRLSNLSEEVPKFADNHNFAMLDNQIDKIATCAKGIFNSAKLLSSFSGRESRRGDNPVPVEICFDEDICRVVFDRLLPHKLKRNHGYEYHAASCADFAEGIHLEASKHPYHYNVKVLFKIIHHYSETSIMTDHDNYEIKPIIDALCTHYFVDDSPKYLALYMDSVMDSKEYTEIIIEPTKD